MKLPPLPPHPATPPPPTPPHPFSPPPLPLLPCSPPLLLTPRAKLFALIEVHIFYPDFEEHFDISTIIKIYEM